jgi:hypothetical protein
VNGNGLHNKCSGPPASFEQGICSGYAVAVIDTVITIQSTGAIGPLFCIPQGVTVEQVTDVVKKYLTDNPVQRHYTASSTAIKALELAFPCPTNQK